MKILRSMLIAIGLLLIIAVVLPLVRSDYWVFRILEYPRFQKFVLCTIVLAALFFTKVYKTNLGLVVVVLLIACVGFLFYKIAPYTALYKREMKSITSTNEKNQLRLYTANVLQDNKSYNKVLQQIEESQPDLIMLLETNAAWEKEMDILLKQYPHALKAPLPNTYGLLFYSRLPMIDGNIKYLVQPDVPSIQTIIQLPSGQLVKVWGLHPKPPVPGENMRSTAKDKELMKVAFAAKNEKLPVIVMGDLNDVAWSHVTELFREVSGLLDPRRGRGFYNTFSAKNWLMRFPLDYVFCSSHFGLINMKRLGHNGSDHFPMFSHFEFQPTLKKQQKKPTPTPEEKEEAADKVKQPV